MRTVTVQLDMVWEDKIANREKVQALLRDQHIVADSLIVLPEMCETGFSMNVEVTSHMPEASESFLRELAREFQSAVLGGFIGRDGHNQPCNIAVAYDPQGNELVRYRKMQPFHFAGEQAAYGAGDQHRIFEWCGVSISPFICYDLRFPEVFRPAARDGAELFVVIACWPAVRSEHWVRLLQARAIENLAYVIGVNRCGEEPNLKFDGRTSYFDHMGKPLFEADAAEQVIQMDIDVSDAREWRKQFPALQNMRF